MAGIFKFIREHGNTGTHHGDKIDSLVLCKDGFTMKVFAGQGVPCTPRVAMCTGDGGPAPHPHHRRWMEACDYPGPYTHFAVEELSEVPPNFSEWQPYCMVLAAPKSFYTQVPAELITKLIEHHGGEIG